MMSYDHVPNFPCYIRYGLQSLECAEQLLVKAAAKNIDTELKHQRDLMIKILSLFLLWSTTISDSNKSLFHSLLESFIDSYLYYSKESTILHEVIFIIQEGYSMTEEQKEAFIEAVLEAGCDKAIDEVDAEGLRPLHRASGSNVKILIKHGAHVDATNSRGEIPLPKGTFGVPSLRCTVANAIVKYSLPYQSIGLPSHVVEFVKLHDPGPPLQRLNQVCVHVHVRCQPPKLSKSPRSRKPFQIHMKPRPLPKPPSYSTITIKPSTPANKPPIPMPQSPPHE